MLNAFFFNTPVENIYLGHQVAEMYKDRMYDPLVLGKKDLTILDVGGNIGIATYFLSQFAKTLHVLEPAQEHYDVLTHMIAFNKLANVTAHKVALAANDGEATFHHMTNKTMHSLRPAAIDPNEKPEQVKTVRLDTFLKQNNIEHVDLMKLDVEGSEADIICSEGFQNAASKVDSLFIEIHAWMGRHTNQLRDGLLMAGFKNITQMPNEATLWICTK